MTDSTQTIVSDDGREFDAYVSRPTAPNGRAIVVLQEIFGVTPAIREVADRLAAAGYLALAPDLFWRLEPGLSLGHSKPDLARAFALLERFDDDLAVRDIAATVAHARATLGGHAPVAVLGMCLGGKLAFLSAARIDVDAAVSFYGVGIERHLDEAMKLRAPLMMHVGGRDPYVRPEAVAAITSAVDEPTRSRMQRYPEGDHGFYTRGAPELIAEAHRRTLDFLDLTLGRR